MQKLKRGDKVAIVSLSSGVLGEPFVKHELDLGIKRLRELGLEPILMDNALRGIDYLKNHPEKKFDDLKSAFASDEVKAIISAIGGNDSFKLFPYIFEDKEFISSVQKNQKIFMGYSDTTAIHLALNKLGLNTFYGPALLTDFAEFEKDMLPYTKNAVDYLFSAPEKYEIKPSEFWYEERKDFSPAMVGTDRVKHNNTGYELIKGSGVVSGELYGGCIELLTNLTGFDACDNLQVERDEVTKKYPVVLTGNELNGKVLFIETSDEKPTPEKFEKMIKHLKELKMFNSIVALLVGKPMDNCNYDEYKQILTNELSDFNFPILLNVNFGHCFPRTIIPYGSTAEIDCNNKTLTLLSTSLK